MVVASSRLNAHGPSIQGSYLLYPSKLTCFSDFPNANNEPPASSLHEWRWLQEAPSDVQHLWNVCLRTNRETPLQSKYNVRVHVFEALFQEGDPNDPDLISFCSRYGQPIFDVADAVELTDLIVSTSVQAFTLEQIHANPQFKYRGTFHADISWAPSLLANALVVWYDSGKFYILWNESSIRHWVGYLRHVTSGEGFILN